LFTRVFEPLEKALENLGYGFSNLPDSAGQNDRSQPHGWLPSLAK
jgi:hypothetical protein